MLRIVDVPQGDYIYLLQDSNHFQQQNGVYKIGKTTQKPYKRAGQYPKGSILFCIVIVDDCSRAEVELIALFHQKYEWESRIGDEYFKGDPVEMMNDILEYQRTHFSMKVLMQKSEARKSLPDDDGLRKRGERKHAKHTVVADTIDEHADVTNTSDAADNTIEKPTHDKDADVNKSKRRPKSKMAAPAVADIDADELATITATPTSKRIEPAESSSSIISADGRQLRSRTVSRANPNAQRRSSSVTPSKPAITTEPTPVKEPVNVEAVTPADETATMSEEVAESSEQVTVEAVVKVDVQPAKHTRGSKSDKPTKTEEAAAKEAAKLAKAKELAKDAKAEEAAKAKAAKEAAKLAKAEEAAKAKAAKEAAKLAKAEEAAKAKAAKEAAAKEKAKPIIRSKGSNKTTTMPAADSKKYSVEDALARYRAKQSAKDMSINKIATILRQFYPSTAGVEAEIDVSYEFGMDAAFIKEIRVYHRKQLIGTYTYGQGMSPLCMLHKIQLTDTQILKKWIPVAIPNQTDYCIHITSLCEYKYKKTPYIRHYVTFADADGYSNDEYDDYDE